MHKMSSISFSGEKAEVQISHLSVVLSGFMAFTQNEFPLAGIYYVKRDESRKYSLYNRLTTSSSVMLDLFVLCLHFYYMEANLFVFRGIPQQEFLSEFKNVFTGQ